eukprot:TRINITY_DN59013_c0_g1_i1.p1 TRINITY_DN59013_c0_g1~~TRINITY_DN59013_c0_g1_i1.p1  ORF type:complete len:151 (-),score=18.81 TRINITY_DN59013_c0_g1_i1:116-568(-)
MLCFAIVVPLALLFASEWNAYRVRKSDALASIEVVALSQNASGDCRNNIVYAREGNYQDMLVYAKQNDYMLCGAGQGEYIALPKSCTSPGSLKTESAEFLNYAKFAEPALLKTCKEPAHSSSERRCGVVHVKVFVFLFLALISSSLAPSS